MTRLVDRISHLPESLVSDILSRLTTKAAVATSALSRSWRFRWTHVTSFDFDNSDQIRREDDTGFEEFVDMVLLHHSGDSIKEFALVWKSANFRPAYLNRWASIAIARNVRRLELKTVNTASAQCEFRLPSSLYTSGTLVYLWLEGPFRVEPPKVVSLPKLLKISLVAVTYESDESLQNLISGCAVLHCVIVRRNKKDNLLDCVISSPVLKLVYIKFDVDDENKGAQQSGDDSKPKLIINAPALVRLHLYDNRCSHISIEPCWSVKKVVLNPPGSSQDIIFQLLQAIASVKFLTLKFDAMVAINRAMEMAGATLPSFERLARLSILRPHWVRWRTVMCLMDSCVRLEELAVWCVKFDGQGRDSWRNPTCAPRCLLSSLKCIAVADFHSTEDMMSMLKYFLEHGSVLERVRICYQFDRSEILEEVSQFPKASPACTISCFENPGSDLYSFYQCF